MAVKRLVKENNTSFESQIKHLENNDALYEMISSIAIDGGYLLIFDHAEVKKWTNDWITIQGKRIFMIWV